MMMQRIPVALLLSVASIWQIPTAQGFVNKGLPTVSYNQKIMAGKDGSDGIYRPPDFSVDDDDDSATDTGRATNAAKKPLYIKPDITFEEPSVRASATDTSSDESFYDMSDETKASSPRRKINRRSVEGGASWMDRNAEFSKTVPEDDFGRREQRDGGNDFQEGNVSGDGQGQRGNAFQSRGDDGWERPRQRGGVARRNNRDDDFERGGGGGGGRGPRKSFSNRGDDDERPNRTFRQDFQGTRVFVQGLPPDANWQDLKDHFRVAGEVVFASVSTDRGTGESKCCGVVQYETTQMAKHAIENMRNFPLDGFTLYVREDVQEQRGEGATLNSRPMKKGPTPPTMWKCANEANEEHLSEDDRMAIRSLIKARDGARFRQQYEASDNMRDELKQEFGVHVDDRLKMWWSSMDDSVPKAIRDAKGEGSWEDPKEWRQIPTTPENDACVNPDLVNGLLTQRDISRKEKDFSTADALLVEARDAPDGDLYLRIHDASRTWRIWTDAPPPRAVYHRENREEAPEKSAAQQCIDITREFSPEKLLEMETLLEKFPGREYNILKKLKQRYLR